MYVLYYVSRAHAWGWEPDVAFILREEMGALLRKAGVEEVGGARRGGNDGGGCRRWRRRLWRWAAGAFEVFSSHGSSVLGNSQVGQILGFHLMIYYYYYYY